MQEFDEKNEQEVLGERAEDQTGGEPEREAPETKPTELQEDEQNEQTPPPEPQDEQTVQPEPEEFSVEYNGAAEHTEPKPEEFSVEYNGAAEHTEPKPAITLDLQPKKPKYKNDGLKAVLILLSILLALAVLVSGGYFIVQRGTDTKNGNISTGLQDKPAGQTASTAQKVYGEASVGVVGILVYNTVGEGPSAQASGVIYTDDGYIVTNDHIYSGIAKPQFKISTSDGKIYDAKYVAGDARSDLAILKTDAPNLKKATFAKTKSLVVGEEVIAIGYPAGIYEKSIMTSGTISSVGRRIVSNTTSYSIRLIQTDTAINPGNSGGALLNMYGQVVGVTSSKLVGTSYDRIGFAIPADTVVKIADSLINHGHVEGRARLGITYTAVDLVSAEVNKCPSGLLVASVSEESNLYGKNIAEGDIITHINDVEITNSIVALDIIDSCKPSDVISLTVYKAQSKTSVTINATMLNDAGASSYTEKDTGATSSGENDSGDGGTFNFPFGE